MAQDGTTAGGASYTLDNVTFPVGRNKLQSIFDAIRSTNIGNTAPDLVAGQFWIDNNTPSTTVWTLYFYDGTDSIQFATIDTINNTVNFIDSAFDLIVDTTPQLGGDLDLNSNDITGTGNINITGNITASGNLAGTLTTASQPNITSVGTLTSLDVGGTITSDDIAVQQSAFTKILIGSTGANGAMLVLDGDSNGDGSGGDYSYIYHKPSGEIEILQNSPSGTNEMLFNTAGNNLRMKIGSGGDISFYEDTGTTPKLFWDASAERLGIGTDSPDFDLDVNGTILAQDEVFADQYRLLDSGGTFRPVLSMDSDDTLIQTGTTTGTRSIFFKTEGTERMRINSSGSVGIGDSNPNARLVVNVATDANFAVQNTAGELQLQGINDAKNSFTSIDIAGNPIKFSPNASEAMRIDSSGNVLVGKTSSNFGTAGVQLQNNGELYATRDGGTVVSINRKSSDGAIVNFAKDGTTVGSIGTNGDLLFMSSANGAGFRLVNDDLRPSTGSTNADDTYDLGHSNVRWKDLYLSGNIYLGGTTSANALDDYEEGTWTPGFKDESANTGSLVSSNAMYTKIGRVVHISMKLSDFDTTGLVASQDLIITGLPFTSSSETGISHSGSVRFNNTPFLTSETNMLFFNSTLGSSSTALKIVGSRNNSSAPALEIQDVDSDSDIVLSMTYMV